MMDPIKNKNFTAVDEYLNYNVSIYDLETRKWSYKINLRLGYGLYKVQRSTSRSFTINVHKKSKCFNYH